jgi:hypothetical protein
MPYERVTYRRSELYERVWERPVTEVAKDYGVSNVRLAKVCKRLGVPLPGRGYWARIAAGQKLPRPKLAPLKKGQEEQFISSRWRPDGVERGVRPDVEDLLDHEHVDDARIVVSATLDAPHELLAQARAVLSKRAGLKKNGGVIIHANDVRCLDIRVTPAVLDRALRVMDAFVKALEARGFPVEVTAPNVSDSNDKAVGSVTRVHVLDDDLEFSLSEGLENVVPRPPPLKRDRTREDLVEWLSRPRYQPKYVPNGKLSLTVTNHGHTGLHHSWSDGKQRLEDRLNTAVRGFVRIADSLRQQRAARERAAQEHERQKRIEAIEAEEKRLEKKRGKDLDARMVTWASAEKLRSFIAGFRKDVAPASGHCVDANMLAWLAWAEDRLAQLEDEAFWPVAPLGCLTDPPPDRGTEREDEYESFAWFTDEDTKRVRETRLRTLPPSVRAG